MNGRPTAEGQTGTVKQYVLHRKLFSTRTLFHIKNPDGKIAYHVRHKSPGLVSEISLRNAQDEELAFVRQKLWALGANYGVYRDGRLWVTLKRTFSLSVRDHFTVFAGGDKELEIFCKFVNEGFEFFRFGLSIAEASRRHFTWMDKIDIRIQPHADEVLVLACTLAVYSAYH